MTSHLPPLSLDLSVTTRFHHVATAVPDQPAVVDGDHCITHAALDAWSDLIASAVAAQAGARARPVALLCSQGPSTLAAMLGVLKAGGIYCVVDPAMPAARLAHILADLAAEPILTDRNHLALAQSLDRVAGRVLEIEGLAAVPSPTNPLPSPGLDDLAAVYYSSGTTGRPKGILRDHAALVHRAWVDTEVVSLRPGDAVAWLYSAAYSASVSDIFGALLNGAALHVYRLHERGMGDLAHWLDSQQIASLHLHADVLRQLLDALPSDHIFRHLRYVRPSDRVAMDDLRRLRRHLPPDSVIAHSLGSGETGPVARFVRRDDTPLEGEIAPVGFPLETVEITLLDAAGQPVIGEGIGEIRVRSRYLARGYWNQPELTAQRFQTDPADSRYRIYRMGDLARRRPDGMLEWLGRNDRRVKIRGYTVDLEAIENALIRLPGVREAIVATKPAARDTALVAYVCLGPAAVERSVSALRAALAQELSAYMLPARFVLLDALPRQPNGKVDVSALPVAGQTRPDLAAPFVAPRGELEQQIADLWAELLELDQVGVEDNFFDLGGDSLLAMRMVLAVEQATGGHVPPEFFRTPTVAHLARVIPHARPPENLALHPVAGRTFGKKRGSSPHVTPRRIVSHITSAGPVWRGHGLPYGLGVRVQRMWIRLPLIRQQLLRRAASFQEWLTILGRADSGGGELELSLLANTWRYWREACVQQPAIFTRWVTVQGMEHLDAALASEQPIVLVGTHTAIRGGAMRMAIRQRTGRKAWTLGRTVTGAPDAAAKIVYARELLAQGGIVHVTGDGAQGTHGVELPVHGRPWLFRSGGAELAVDTGAVMLPVFNTLARSGHITVEFLSPLISIQTARQAQIEDLTRQYAALLVARWPSLLSNVKWDKLQQILDYARGLG